MFKVFPKLKTGYSGGDMSSQVVRIAYSQRH